MRSSRRWSWSAPILLSFGSAIAQGTLVVGPGQQFTNIQQAIDASAPGDTILVNQDPAGTHGYAYTISAVPHSLTIRGLVWPVFVQAMTLTLGANVQLHLQDLDFLGASPLVGHGSSIHGGLVTMEDVGFGGGAQYAPVPSLTIADAHVVMRSSGANGLVLVQDSDLAAVDCHLLGEPATAGYTPSPGLAAVRSTVRLSHSYVVCGGSAPGANALWAPSNVVMSALSLSASVASLVDSYVVSAPFAEPTAVVDAASTLTFDRTTFTPGAGTGNGVAGIATPATLLGATMPEGRLQLGGSMTPTFVAQPSMPVFVLATLQLAPPTPAPFVHPEHWGFAGPGTALLGLRITDAAGRAAVPIALPGNPVFLDRGIWLMGALGPNVPFELSLPVGGILQ